MKGNKNTQQDLAPLLPDRESVFSWSGRRRKSLDRPELFIDRGSFDGLLISGYDKIMTSIMVSGNCRYVSSPHFRTRDAGGELTP